MKPLVVFLVVSTVVSSVSATCYDASRNIIADCVCHPLCDTCGYAPDPTRDVDCITCRGTNILQHPAGGTGSCEMSEEDVFCGDFYHELSLCWKEHEQSCSSCRPVAPIETGLFCEDYQRQWCALGDCCVACSSSALAYFNCVAKQPDDNTTCVLRHCSAPMRSSLGVTSIVGIVFGALMLLLCLGSATLQWITEQRDRKQHGTAAEDLDLGGTVSRDTADTSSTGFFRSHLSSRSLWCTCSWFSCFETGPSRSCSSLDNQDGEDASVHAATAEFPAQPEEPPFATVALPILLPIAEEDATCLPTEYANNTAEEDAILATLRAARPARTAPQHHHRLQSMGKMARMSVPL